MSNRLQGLLERMGFSFREGPKTSLFSEQAIDKFLVAFTQMADPDEVLRRAGITRPRLRALEGDDEITTAMDTRRGALVGTPWLIEGDAEPIVYVQGVIKPHADKLLRGCMAALPYGYSVQEVVYKRDGGRIGIAHVDEKPFEWFIPQLDGSVLYRSRENPQGEVTDPRKYLLTVHNQTWRNPYGEALFSRLYWPWFFRSQGWRFWAKWLERFGTPFIIGQTAGDAKQMADQLARAVQDAVIAVGSGDKVEIAESSGQGAGFEAFERRICARIQKVILGQTLTTETSSATGGGSYALGEVQNEVRRDRHDADVRMVAPTIQKLVDTLWALNGFPGTPPPFVLQDETGIETERADRDAKLTQAGAIKLKPEYFTRAYDYEIEDLDVEAMTAPPPEVVQAPGAKPPAKGAKAGAVVFGTRFTPQQQVIEDALAPILADGLSPLDPKDIREAILAAADPDDLVARLAVLMNGRSMDAFRTVLERALFAADILGYAHAQSTPPPAARKD